jgi:hypothetical protein
MVYIWYLFKKHHQIYMGIENTIGVWYNNVSKKKQLLDVTGVEDAVFQESNLVLFRLAKSGM